MEFEYRVVPAPKRLRKPRGVSTDEAFATALTEAINAEARLGWEYLHAETMTAECARGAFRRAVTVEETVLVFRRQRLGPRVAGTPHEVTAEPALRMPEARPAAARRDTEAGPSQGNGQPPEAEPVAHASAPRGAESDALPPLLRPVPRFRPGGEPG